MHRRPDTGAELRSWRPPLDVLVRENTDRWWQQRTAAEAELSDLTPARDWRLHPDAWRQAARPVDAGMPDSAIRGLAAERVRIVGEWLDRLTTPSTPGAMLGAVNQAIQPLEARPFDFGDRDPTPDELAGVLARVRCDLWWRRQLRRAVVRKREGQGIRRGEVRRGRQVYATDDTCARRAESAARNAAMLECTKLEADDGEVITLAQAVAASTANKAVRRGELMTRIRGCEEWAEAAGMVGLFTTNTAPSRFHRTSHGDDNPRWDGSTPRDAQQWLCATWARARAALQRRGLRFFGFRVAEPHADGCPHWHMLLWTDPGTLDALRDTLRAYWLKEAGDEPGAARFRFNARTMDRGGAAGYVAKYIAKNIDDAGAVAAEGHRDEDAEGQFTLYGAKAARVESWAAAWSIRQFQAIGQPPVTVWRELRRVKPETLDRADASHTLRLAHEAVHRDGDRRADWRLYMAAQGGPMVGRRYRVRIAADVVQREGRYGVAELPRPVGVVDSHQPGPWVLSERRQWRPAGTWRDAASVRSAPLLVLAAPQAAPLGPVSTTVRGWKGSSLYRMAPRPLFGPRGDITRAAGAATTEETPCPMPPPPPPAPPPPWLPRSGA